MPPSRLSPLLQRIALLAFVLFVALSAVCALTEHWRRATFVLGGALCLLAVVRLTCDSKLLGVLAVRSRNFDVFFETVLGLVMVFLAVSVDSLGS
ncbi:DUF3017 domain-containing protein [Corynebacterium sp. H128]|uniref:DUF3017 domain-containing protein n=1 Tax=unclassified Corynebacterium TaxID=2624378 RepID=UPI0030B56359